MCVLFGHGLGNRSLLVTLFFDTIRIPVRSNGRRRVNKFYGFLIIYLPISLTKNYCKNLLFPGKWDANSPSKF